MSRHRRGKSRSAFPVAPAGPHFVQHLVAGEWRLRNAVRVAVSTAATVARVMSITEVIKDGGAITKFRVTEFDHLAQLATLQTGAPFDVAGSNAQLVRAN